MRTDSLNSELSSTKQELDDITRTKNNITVFGININKTLYNTIMLCIIAGLVFLLASGYLAFSRTRALTNYTRKEFEELKDEFENYRKESREAREKMVMTHFNEIKRLKGL